MPSFRTSRWRSLCALAILLLSVLLTVPAEAQDPVFRPRSSAPRDFVEVGGRLVFFATTGAEEGAAELWRTDGTTGGTVRLAQCPGTCSTENGFALRTPGGELAFFTSSDFRTRTRTLWRTDGTAEGTLALVTLPEIEVNPAGYQWSEAGGRLFFNVYRNDTNTLWVSDGTRAGTRPVYVFGRRGAGLLAVLGEKILLAVTTLGTDEADRSELWVSDGTTTGTTPLLEVGSGVSSALALAERVVFLASVRGACAWTLWTTDGTAAGTAQLETYETPRCDMPSPLERAGDWAVFTTAPGAIANLWRTDGTSQGTVPVTAFTTPDSFLPFGPHSRTIWQPPHLYFVAGNRTPVGAEVWRSEGSPGTTEVVADLCPGPCTSQPALLGPVGGDRVLFKSGDFFTGYHPWITDGTAAGTRRLAEVDTGWHQVIGERVVFSGFTQAMRYEVWAADLASGHAGPLTDFVLDSGVSTEDRSAARLGGVVLFAASDPLHGTELWRSDGTAAGTFLLANLAADGEIPTAPPQVPANVAVSPIGDDVLEVRWDPVPGAERYYLSIRGVEGAFGSTELPVFDTTVFPIVPLGTPVTVQVRAENVHGSSAWSEPVSGTAFEPGLQPGECPSGDDALCLQQGRFRVRTHWRNQHATAGAVAQGTGRAIAPAGNASSGYFWFFTEDNVELIVKLLDGTTVNGFQWAFYGALSDVEYWITVTDTASGLSRTYHNPPGTICGRGDTRAFAGTRAAWEAVAASRAAPPAVAAARTAGRTAAALPGPCQAGEGTLCLLDGRYEVTVDWRDQHNDQQGFGRSVPFRDLSGFFWFFHPDNIELVVKVLDGTTVNGKVWVFYGALSDVGYTLRVRETATGRVAEYVNPPGNLCGGADTGAF